MVPLEWRGWSTLWFLHGDGKCLIQILIMANSKVGFINRKEMQLYYHITYRIYQLGKMIVLKKIDPFTLAEIKIRIYFISILTFGVFINTSCVQKDTNSDQNNQSAEIVDSIGLKAETIF